MRGILNLCPHCAPLNGRASEKGATNIRSCSVCSSALGKSKQKKNREPPRLSYAFPHHTDIIQTLRMARFAAAVNNAAGESPSTEKNDS
jgi:uncharacterized protein (DUF983 family)